MLNLTQVDQLPINLQVIEVESKMTWFSVESDCHINFNKTCTRSKRKTHCIGVVGLLKAETGRATTKTKSEIMTFDPVVR
jgi:hypothetical protein